MTDDPAIETFLAAHAQLRIRAAFRLAGILATVVTAFVISLDSLDAYHDGAPVLIPLPFVACWLLGHLGAATYRLHTERHPQIPRARVVR